MQSDAELALAHQKGRAAWPGVHLPLEHFIRRVRELSVPVDALEAQAADLYLAFACAFGDRPAISRFDTEVLGPLPMYVSRFGLTEAEFDELRQRLRVKLLVGPNAGIVGYRGQGSLAAWVRISGVRLATNLKTPRGIKTDTDTGLLDVCVSRDSSPELETAKRLYRERFHRALKECLETLTSRERTLLRLHFLDGMSLDAMGVLYRVHRATAARWLAAIRSQVFEALRREFGRGICATASEVRSLVELLGQDVNLSVKRILAESAA